MAKIVHLDLKGAPLKIPYLEKVIIMAKKWDATGILYEWEDTFPYTADLVAIGSNGSSCGEDMYTLDEVRHILEFTKAIGLEPIQLVQTIGHMEFVLKHPAFIDLREDARYPSVLCPSKTKSLELVQLMIEQVLNVQPDAEYIHIGADEVWHQAVCNDCKKRASENVYKEQSLYLQHIRNLALFIKQKRPRLKIFIWDDMIRSIRKEPLIEYNLNELVVPVVWNYEELEYFRICPLAWQTYKEVFPAVWAASAFKGANGSCKIVSSVKRYVSNNKAWMNKIQENWPGYNFDGIILTGWSRYDHYATLCELMPVSLPSLCRCLKVLPPSKPSGDKNAVGHGDDGILDENLPDIEWPGKELASNICNVARLKSECDTLLHGDNVMTWMNPWQVTRGYTNPQQVERLAGYAKHLLNNFLPLKEVVELQLQTITGPKSIDEWMNTFVTPSINKLMELSNIGDDILRRGASVQPLKPLN